MVAISIVFSLRISNTFCKYVYHNCMNILNPYYSEKHEISPFMIMRGDKIVYITFYIDKMLISKVHPCQSESFLFLALYIPIDCMAQTIQEGQYLP